MKFAKVRNGFAKTIKTNHGIALAVLAALGLHALDATRLTQKTTNTNGSSLKRTVNTSSDVLNVATTMKEKEE